MRNRLDPSRKPQQRLIELAQINKRLSGILEEAAHDLRGDLRKSLQYVDILDDELGTDTSADVQRCIGVIAGSNRRAMVLVDKLRIYVSALTSEPEPEPVDLNTVIDELAVDSQADIKRTELPKIECDLSLIGSLFRELVANSIAFQAENAEPKIKISAQRLGTHYIISLDDNGLGFPTDATNDPFEPFVQLHSKFNYPGAGLGLPIAKTVCDKHGWTITIGDTLDTGASIVISIPTNH